MIWLIIFLTAILVLDALFLTLLILVQLPKKEAGLGQAFGGATTDALFGAGSGNALTKMTKYATVIFLLLTLFLSILNAKNKARSATSDVEREMQRLNKQTPPTPSTLPPTAVLPENLATNAFSTNAASTNTAPKPAPVPPAAPAKTNVATPSAPVTPPAPAPNAGTNAPTPAK